MLNPPTPLMKIFKRKNNNKINTTHLSMLGKHAVDKVTGFKGVTSVISYDLYGCIQVVITPPSSATEVYAGNWFDVTRVHITSDDLVMNVPDYSATYTRDFGMLGLTVKDKVTGFEGVVTSLSYDLYNNVHFAITPKSTETDVFGGGWFDYERLDILSETPVMDLPDFSKGYVSEGRKGAAPKPPL